MKIQFGVSRYNVNYTVSLKYYTYNTADERQRPEVSIICSMQVKSEPNVVAIHSSIHNVV